MTAIRGSVGRNGNNRADDVLVVQRLLNRHIARLALPASLKEDGVNGQRTIGAIEAFQRSVMGMGRPDGRVDPGGRTITALAAPTERATALPTAGRTSRMPLPPFDLQRFYTRLDQHPDLKGVRVVYFDGNHMHVLREGPPYCALGLKAVVIREPTELPVLQVAEAAAARDSRLLTELLSLGLSCSAALLGWTVVIGASGAAPLTGGTSTFLALAAKGAAFASSVQCVNALGRSGAETLNPDVLDILDTMAWYRNTSLVLDAVSLAGAATATATTVRLALHLRATTGKSMVQVLQGLSRQQRKTLAEEAVRANHPGIGNAQLKAFVRAGEYPKRLTPLHINATVHRQLRDAAGAAASFGGSAASGIIRNAGELVIGISSSVETY